MTHVIQFSIGYNIQLVNVFIIEIDYFDSDWQIRIKKAIADPNIPYRFTRCS